MKNRQNYQTLISFYVNYNYTLWQNLLSISKLDPTFIFIENEKLPMVLMKCYYYNIFYSTTPVTVSILFVEFAHQTIIADLYVFERVFLLFFMNTLF